MKINTQILRGLKTLNEAVSDSKLGKEIINCIDSITKLTNKDGIKIPYIGVYDNSENREYYKFYGISDTQITAAEKEIAKIIANRFKPFGRIPTDNVRCHYVIDKYGTYRFPNIKEKFTVFIKLGIIVSPSTWVFISGGPKDNTKIEIQIGNLNDNLKYLELTPKQLKELYSELSKPINFIKEFN